MTNSNETRIVTSYRHVTEEISVEELRKEADAMESEPYGADYVKLPAQSTKKCEKRTMEELPDGEITRFCQNAATHGYVSAAGGIEYCADCARKMAQKRAARFRRNVRI